MYHVGEREVENEQYSGGVGARLTQRLPQSVVFHGPAL